MNRSIPAWLQGVQALNPQAVEQMYNELSPELYRYAYRLSGNQQDAEDILADAFIRLLQALQHRQMQVDSIRAYLYRVVHNRAVDGFRRQKHTAADMDPSEFEGSPDREEAALVDFLAVEQVRSALWQLTDQQRQVIMLRYYQNLSFEEIGAVMDKPVGAVKALRQRGLEALRRIFRHQDEVRGSHGEEDNQSE